MIQCPRLSAVVLVARLVLHERCSERTSNKCGAHDLTLPLPRPPPPIFHVLLRQSSLVDFLPTKNLTNVLRTSLALLSTSALLNTYITCMYLKLADSSIDSCIQGPIQLHGEGIGGLAGVTTDTGDHCL